MVMACRFLCVIRTFISKQMVILRLKQFSDWLTQMLVTEEWIIGLSSVTRLCILARNSLFLSNTGR